MKKLLFTAGLMLSASALACPKYDTMFNGSGFTIVGMNPYCTDSGRRLAADFRSGYLEAGAKVNWVEGYQVTLNDSAERVMESLDTLIEKMGFEYVDMAEGEYNTIGIYHKVGTADEGLMVSLEAVSGKILVMLVEGRFPYMVQQ